MGQTTDQIEAHIENTREELGSNLQELERKVKSVTDWREQFRANPMTLMAAAFGGGVLLSSMLGRSKPRRYRRRYQPNYAPIEQHQPSDHGSGQFTETVDKIRGALVGVAAARLKDFVGDVVPGFHEQFDRAQPATNPTNR
jgi:hypothetical protein